MTRKQYLKKKRKSTSRRRGWLVPLIIVLVVLLCAGIGVFAWWILRNRPAPEDTVRNYFSLLSEKKYDEMYALLSDSSKDSISEEDFISRNQNIYEGIEASDIQITLPEEDSGSSKATETVTYSTSMDTSAGAVTFDNQMTLEKNSDGEYRVNWDSTLIFPSLQDDYKVRVETQTAQRGSIYDRNGTALATQGTVSEVGLVPGKMNASPEADIARIAELLGMNAEDITTSLNASYVQDDTFVPLKQISKSDTETEAQLLEIPGILINDAEARVYPLGAAAGHLTGYVQSVTAEDLEENRDRATMPTASSEKLVSSLPMKNSCAPSTGPRSSSLTQRETRSRLSLRRKPRTARMSMSRSTPHCSRQHMSSLQQIPEQRRQ